MTRSPPSDPHDRRMKFGMCFYYLCRSKPVFSIRPPIEFIEQAMTEAQSRPDYLTASPMYVIEEVFPVVERQHAKVLEACLKTRAHWLVRDPHRAEDVAQESFLQIHRVLLRGGFDPERAKIETFSRTIVNRVAIRLAEGDPTKPQLQLRVKGTDPRQVIVPREVLSSQEIINNTHAKVNSLDEFHTKDLLNAILHRAWLYGKNDKRLKTVIDLLMLGFTLKEVAMKLGITYRSLINWLIDLRNDNITGDD